MAYTGIQMLMKKLNQLIHPSDIPFFNNNPEIISQRPQFQLLYDELQSMIQTLGFIHQHQDSNELEQVNHLTKRFTDAVEEAQYILDLFVSSLYIRDNGTFPTSAGFNPSLNIGHIRRSFKSIEVEFMSLRMKMDSSETTVTPSAQSFISINTKKISDEFVVGLDHDVELIRDKLVADQKKLDVISVVGMAGIGKTTLATKVYNDAYVKHHFHVRVWVTVSQTYDKRAVLIQILESIRFQLGLREASDSRLREMVHKSLMGRRYLIVIDDIWDIETWDSLKLFFPRDNNGSRILLTSRITEVAKHANSDGLIHHLGYLNKQRSWQLLCKRVFYDDWFPVWSYIPGMQIAENCQGLPLAVVVIAGVLSRHRVNRDMWIQIAERTSSYIVGEENGYQEALSLSYSHLPLHLKKCFLYLGGFPEDHKFEVQRLIWLWVAEGFIEEDGNRSLEDIAEGYLIDLIDRNLVIVAGRRNFDGTVIDCKVHDLVRELCLRKSKEEGFILKTERPVMSSNVITPPCKSVHMFINNTDDPFLTHSPTLNLRSILCFSDFRSLSDDITKYFRSFVLLRVLDLHKSESSYFPKGIELLVHLRYLAINITLGDFPSSICKLWNLQTLIYITIASRVYLPSNISDLVNLRHLWGSLCTDFVFNSIEKPMNLQTISRLCLEDKAHSFQKYFPCVKKLSCSNVTDKQNDFKSFTYLESLALVGSHINKPKKLTFPAALKTLKLVRCNLPWSDMSIIQSLPNLQVLELGRNAFKGSCWNTNEQVFPQLNFLILNWFSIMQWEVYSTSFPCLRELKIANCYYLEEIPLEIGDIPTLELIEIQHCRQSIDESVKRIQQEQQYMGNYDLRIKVIQSKAQMSNISRLSKFDNLFYKANIISRWTL